MVERVTILGDACEFSVNAKDTEDQYEVGDGVPDVGVPVGEDSSLVDEYPVLASEAAVGEPARQAGEESQGLVMRTAATLTLLRLLPGTTVTAAWVLAGKGCVTALCITGCGCGCGGRTLTSTGNRNGRGLCCCELGIRSTPESFCCRCCGSGCVWCRHNCGCLLGSTARRSRTARNSSSLADIFLSKFETR